MSEFPLFETTDLKRIKVLHKANNQLVEEIERLECVIKYIKSTTKCDETIDVCSKALEVNNAG